MLQSLGVPPRVILLVCCDFLTLFACTLFVLCLRALWGGLDITSYGWMLSMLLLAPVMGHTVPLSTWPITLPPAVLRTLTLLDLIIT